MNCGCQGNECGPPASNQAATQSTKQATIRKSTPGRSAFDVAQQEIGGKEEMVTKRRQKEQAVNPQRIRNSKGRIVNVGSGCSWARSDVTVGRREAVTVLLMHQLETNRTVGKNAVGAEKKLGEGDEGELDGRKEVNCLQSPNWHAIFSEVRARPGVQGQFQGGKLTPSQ